LPIYNSNDLSRGIERMLDDQSYYLIGYQPDTETFDPNKRRFNKFTIKVKRKDARVRYEADFSASGDERFKTPPAQTPTQQILAALTSPFAAKRYFFAHQHSFRNDARQGSSCARCCTSTRKI
jgi:hypothetical protein